MSIKTQIFFFLSSAKSVGVIYGYIRRTGYCIKTGLNLENGDSPEFLNAL